VRHATPDGETERLHPVATDQPGLILHRPLQKLRQIAIVYALLPLLCAALGAWVAYRLTEASTDRRIAALEQDLAQRRAARAEQDAARDRQLGELRLLVCIFADHSQPRDDQVEAVRARYGCTGGPYPEPQSPPATPGRGGTSAGTRPSGVLPPPVRTTSAIAVPSPTRGPPQPSPTGDGAGPLLCVKLPLLPRVCL
jgi:hypothetical protein